MQSDWVDFLATRDATLEGKRVLHFGDPAAELAAIRTSTILCDLSHLGLIRAAGDDAQDFLQGQLSNDVKQATAARAQYGSYNTPKGRMLASLLIFRNATGFLLQLPRELSEPVRKRLSMYVLRSRVMLTDASDAEIRIGLAGPKARALLERARLAVPAEAMDVVQSEGSIVIRLPGERFEIVTSLSKARLLWDDLIRDATPAGAACWDWLEIQAGIPLITQATQDQFVPQMVNFELIGGVSFNKGCYPGQEIVARTHYLGKLKRRMYLAHVAPPAVPRTGDELFSADLEGQASGMVVNVAPSPEVGYDLLAVIQTASAESQPVHLGSIKGPLLELRALPYAVP